MNDVAFRLFKGALLDSMFLGLAPGNVGMATYFDMARGESQRDFADGNRVFARLDVHIGDAGRAMMNQQFGELFVLGAITVQRAIVAAHPAIGAVLAAKIRDFNDRADENIPAEHVSRGGAGAFVKGGLMRAIPDEVEFVGEKL
jgi:hypothetical protein